MSDFMAKMHKKRSPDLLVVLKGPTSKGREGVYKERKRRRREREEGKWSENGKGRGGERKEREREMEGRIGKAFAGPMSNCFLRA